jgi:molybdate transport system substrate-binding protein
MSGRRNLLAHRLAAIVVLSSGIGLAAIACQRSDADASRKSPDCAPGPIRMGVASSLREIALELARDLAAERPPLRVESSFGASSALARQLELGAPIDVMVSADEQIVAALAAQRLLVPASIREIARGELTLVARRGSDFEGLGIEALRSPLLERLAVPGAAVPLGRYGRSWLEARGLLESLGGKIVATENARATLAAVEQGHVDLALLYETDLRLARSLERIHRPDPERYPEIRYEIARATRSAGCAAIDRALDAWQSASSRARLLRAGFELPARSDAMRPTTIGSEPS